MKIKFIVAIALVIFIIATYVEKRSFYCLENGQCVTLWRTFNRNCYIIPGKFYGLVVPSDNVIKTPSSNNLTIYFSSELPNAIVYKSEQQLELKNRGKDVFTFYDYSSNEKMYDNIFYLPDSKKHNDVKKTVQLIDISVGENFALDRKGRRL